MTRNKKEKTGGKARGAKKKEQDPWTKTLPSRLSKSRNFEDGPATPSYTLRDVAWNSEHRSTVWSSGVNLRNKSIGFVRSSENIQSESEGKKDGTSVGEGARIDPFNRDIRGGPARQTPSENDQGTASFPTFNDVLDTLDNTLSVPTVANESIRPDGKEKVQSVKENRVRSKQGVRPSSPTPSNSSDEVVFTGRGAPRKRNAAKPREDTVPNGQSPKITNPHQRACAPALAQPEKPAQPAWDHSLSTRVQKSERAAKRLDPLVQVNARKPRIPARNKPPYKWDHQSERNAQQHAPGSCPNQVSRKASGRKRRSNELEHDESVAQAIVDDYIDNIEKSGLLENQFDKPVLPVNQPGPESNAWTRETLGDFDDLSTSEEILDAVSRIISKRQRPSGTQYLVVWDGQGVDEARWIPHASLTMQGASTMIRVFEEEELNVRDDVEPSTDSNEDTNNQEDEEGWLDEDEDPDEDADFEDEQDEADLTARKEERMTDERIARLLSKQEELGLGSDALQILDDDEDTDGYDAEVTRAARTHWRVPRHQNRLRKSKPGDPVLDVAEGVLDDEDYGDFDVMEWEGKSLKAPRKGRGDTAAFALSDPDLEKTLRESWAMDRKMKKAKKQEREKLRAQGLLGTKGKRKRNSATTSGDWPDLEQTREDLEVFLDGDSTTYALPPMDKKERKVIHEIANAFNLKSKSSGSGRGRYPVLYKTKHTLDFEDSVFSRALTRRKGRLLPKSQRNGKAGPGKKFGEGASKFNTSYMEGEVVGAAAPELGEDNRGRALLEKMGWNRGDALGAMHNKGRLEPVEHVIKKGKAGLG